jgi:hypothetical protein
MSYRRSDDPNFTGRFHDKLIGVFGEENVFRDIDSLAAGTRFADVITESLDHVDAVVALIGPTWVGRLESPTDFVRMEISHALGAGKPVIPVLIEDTPLPEVAALPEDLQSLLEINAVRVRRDPDFHRDAARVVSGIRESVQAASERKAQIRRQQEAVDQQRREAEEKESQAREAALRRRLQEELVRAEAQEAERRQAAEALERERLERLVELARLEEEATRRQIADERLRLAALEETKQRRDEEVNAAQARAQELRDLLARPEPLAPAAAAEVIGRPLPPPKVLPPIPPSDLRAEPAAVTAPAPTKPRTRHWVTSHRAYVVGAACVVGATAVAISALSTTGEYIGSPLSWGTSSDINAVVLTLGLLAPLLARSARDAAAITTGVTVGYLTHLALMEVSWFWGVDGGPAWPAYRTAIVVVGLLMIGARVMFGRHRELDARTLRPNPGALVAQIGLTIVITVSVATYLNRWHTYYKGLYSEDLDSDIWVTPGAQIPRLAVLFLLPSLLLVVLATRRTHRAAVTLTALASMSSVAYLTDAYDTGGSVTSQLARGGFLLAAVAAVGIVAITLYRLVWS